LRKGHWFGLETGFANQSSASLGRKLAKASLSLSIVSLGLFENLVEPFLKQFHVPGVGDRIENGLVLSTLLAMYLNRLRPRVFVRLGYFTIPHEENPSSGG
jgi:hypothetical protein